MRSIAKTLLFVGFLLGLASTLVAADPVYLPRLSPLDPTIIAQGGSSTAVARGYQAFLTNPAGFRVKGGSLTLLSTTAWLRARPEILLDDLQSMDLGNPRWLLSTLEHQYVGGVDSSGREYPGNGAVGIGASTGIGWSGGGIGLGLISTFEATTYGKSFPLGITGELHGGFDFIGGIALPIRIFGTELSIGGDVRPLVRIYAPLTASTVADVLSALSDEPLSQLTGTPTLNGYGLAIDAGAIATIGPLNLALSARDLFGTRVGFAEHSLTDVISSLQRGGLPDEDLGQPISTDYRIPMAVSLGGSYHPNLGPMRHLVDPMVHFEVSDFFALIREDHLSLWTRLHLGAELRLLRFLKLRAGINQGYFTVGAGAKLLFLDVNVALFSEEFGRFSGDRRSAGVAVEAAIRF